MSNLARRVKALESRSGGTEQGVLVVHSTLAGLRPNPAPDMEPCDEHGPDCRVRRMARTESGRVTIGHRGRLWVPERWREGNSNPGGPAETKDRIRAKA